MARESNLPLTRRRHSLRLTPRFSSFLLAGTTCWTAWNSKNAPFVQAVSSPAVVCNNEHGPCQKSETATTFASTNQKQQQQQRRKSRSPWGFAASPLPLLPHQHGRNFLEECENFLDFLGRFRGGGGENDFDRRANDFDRGYGNYKNDYYGDDRAGGGYDGDFYSSSPYYTNDPYGGGGGNDYGDGFDDDDYYYDDRGGAGRRRNERQGMSSSSSSAFGVSMDMLPSIFKTGDRRVGLSLVGAGSVLTILGIGLFFNKALLRLGNLLFIFGVAITMGISRTANFFFQAEKLRATLCLGFGILLVFWGSPVLGMVCEIFGLLNLFGNMFPVILAVAKTLPGIGPLLNNMGNNSNNQRTSKGSRGGPRKKERYYDDGDDYLDDDDDDYGNDYYYGGDRPGGRSSGDYYDPAGYPDDDRYRPQY